MVNRKTIDRGQQKICHCKLARGKKPTSRESPNQITLWANNSDDNNKYQESRGVLPCLALGTNTNTLPTLKVQRQREKLQWKNKRIWLPFDDYVCANAKLWLCGFSPEFSQLRSSVIQSSTAPESGCKCKLVWVTDGFLIDWLWWLTFSHDSNAVQRLI